MLEQRLLEEGCLFASLYVCVSTLGLRYFNVYGPRQDPGSPYAGVISRFAARLARDEPLAVFGDGGQTRDFVFVKDVARANLAALRSSYNGILNVGTGTSVTLLELIDALARCSGRTPRITFDPPAPGDIRHSAMRPDRIRETLQFSAQTSLIEASHPDLSRGTAGSAAASRDAPVQGAVRAGCTISDSRIGRNHRIMARAEHAVTAKSRVARRRSSSGALRTHADDWHAPC